MPGALDRRPQGYIDQDVYEAARAFTGWSIEDGAGIGAGRRLLMTGKFVYVENWHDNYQKRVLATEFDPYQSPLADGRRVLDLVADHPATARHVCEKLCRRRARTRPMPPSLLGPGLDRGGNDGGIGRVRHQATTELFADIPRPRGMSASSSRRRLVSDTPDAAVVAAAVKAWTEQRRKPDQIARTVEAIVHSDAFRRSAGTKVKRPLELCSFARSAGDCWTPTPACWASSMQRPAARSAGGRRPVILTKTTIG